MPLMWIFSFMMVCFLMFMSYYLYYMKNNMNVDFNNSEMQFVKMSWMW